MLNSVMRLSSIKYLFIFLSSILICIEGQSSPVGKNLSCFMDNKTNENYLSFRGISFETDKSVRVASLKVKNNQLKVISKLTPYKLKKTIINFKIKFIWYGNIFFEDFSLDRTSLKLFHSKNKDINELSCKIVKGDFMSEMNKKRDELQKVLDKSLNDKKI